MSSESTQIWTAQIGSTQHIISIESRALQTINEWRQYDFYKQPEACGILLGERRGDHLRVITATPPQITDQRTPTWYQRNAQGHQQILDAWHTQSNGTIGYLGEWHTHPQKVPTPSLKDYMEWSKTGKYCEHYSALTLFLIAGTQAEWLGAMIHGTLKQASLIGSA